MGSLLRRLLLWLLWNRRLTRMLNHVWEGVLLEMGGELVHEGVNLCRIVVPVVTLVVGAASTAAVLSSASSSSAL